MPLKLPVIAILDIGKTNKKAFLFDEQYRIVFERTSQLSETTDEDGFPCEDVDRLRDWIREVFASMVSMDEFEVKAVNVSAYGASLVHVDEQGEILKPLYNYLKPYPVGLEEKFYEAYGGRDQVSLETSSPALGSLNSGLQLYRLAKEREIIFTQVHKSLHLPQFASWIITGQLWSDVTSIGCHTFLWDFSGKKYHRWVAAEGVEGRLPPIHSSEVPVSFVVGNKHLKAGIGLHDSSAALIPYLAQFTDPFLLLSTGTWNISLNPFSQSPLTPDELRHDCLCYLDYRGSPVKASRLFAGHAHEQQTKSLADHYHVDPEFYKGVVWDAAMVRLHQQSAAEKSEAPVGAGTGVYQSRFAGRDIKSMASYEEAYHQLMMDIMDDQVSATKRIMDANDRSSRIFVDGGFSQNEIFMKLLAGAFPGKQVFAASLHQASALGAALAIHSSWNPLPVPEGLIELKGF